MIIRLLFYCVLFAFIIEINAQDAETSTEKVDRTDATGENNDGNTTEVVTNANDATGQTDTVAENDVTALNDTVVENDLTAQTDTVDEHDATNESDFYNTTDTIDTNNTISDINNTDVTNVPEENSVTDDPDYLDFDDNTENTNVIEEVTTNNISDSTNNDECETADTQDSLEDSSLDDYMDITEDPDADASGSNNTSDGVPVLPPTCDSMIYCQGILLHTIQMSRTFEDSKKFVDMGLENDPGMTLAKFNKLMKETDNKPSNSQLETFVKGNFKTEDELISWTPEDYDSSPCFVSDIKDPEIKTFALEIIKMWKELGKKVAEHVFYYPDRHSLLPLPYGFIASGGRYKEYYYWDNYWIVDALITCGMSNTAKGMIDNFVTLIIKYGYVPNGGRKYYVHRTQPPMLPYMVMRYYEETTDVLWLRSYIEYFEREIQFWVEKRMFQLTVGDREYSVGIYKSQSMGPRPEAYYEDLTAAEYYKSKEEREAYYNDVKASAESGWDSSSRWTFDVEGGTTSNLTFSQISRVVPVDLNAFLFGAFNIMSKLYLDLENYGKQIYWHKKATDMYVTINKLFWNDEDGIWYDYDMHTHQQRKNFYASNLIPLWTNAINITWCKKEQQIDKVIKYLKTNGLLDFPGGIPSSLQNTGNQWDMPNVWPPLQSMIVNGFHNTGISKAKYEARKLAQRFINATRTSFSDDGAMYQRYHAEELGRPGPQGEYKTQKVFAWTNAVALQFIDKYYTIKRFE